MNTEHNKKTEDILNSLDGVKRASPNEFFYTRLKARMEKELLPTGINQKGLRPAYAFSLLLVVLVANAVVLFSKGNSGDNPTAVNEREILQSIAAEYNPNDVGSLYDLNEER